MLGDMYLFCGSRQLPSAHLRASRAERRALAAEGAELALVGQLVWDDRKLG